MQGDRSSYEILGLEHDAPREAVDRAFRSLIKQYHPDRVGGDRQRAEEIIAAYRNLTGRRVAIDDLELNDRGDERGISAGWQIAGLLLAISLLILALVAGPFDSGFAARLRALDLSGRAADAAWKGYSAEGLEKPIDDAAVKAMTKRAESDFRRLDEAGLADVSRECRQRYHQQPSAAAFDRCAVYDFAIVNLQDRDPVGDRGQFQEVAVIRRQWANAAMLTNDSYRIDSRIDRLKLKVELLLAPDLPIPQVSVPPVEEMPQRLDVVPSGASVDEVPSSDSDQRRLSEAENFSE